MSAWLPRIPLTMSAARSSLTGDAQSPSANLPGWFAAMDTSRDGVISGREFLGSPEKFAALDKNQNGFFEPSEIPLVPGATADTTAAEGAASETPASASPAKESKEDAEKSNG